MSSSGYHVSDGEWAQWEEYVRHYYGVQPPADEWPDSLDAVGCIANMTYRRATQNGDWQDVILSDGRVITKGGFIEWLDLVVPALMDQVQEALLRANTFEDYGTLVYWYQAVRALCAYHEPEVMAQKEIAMRVQMEARYLEILERMEDARFNGIQAEGKKDSPSSDQDAVPPHVQYDDILSFKILGDTILHRFGESAHWHAHPHNSNFQRLAPEAFAYGILSLIHQGDQAKTGTDKLNILGEAVHRAHVAEQMVAKPFDHLILLEAFVLLDRDFNITQSWPFRLRYNELQRHQLSMLQQRLHALAPQRT